jgi:hypothetical protein
VILFGGAVAEIPQEIALSSPKAGEWRRFCGRARASAAPL